MSCLPFDGVPITSTRLFRHHNQRKNMSLPRVWERYSCFSSQQAHSLHAIEVGAVGAHTVWGSAGVLKGVQNVYIMHLNHYTHSRQIALEATSVTTNFSFGAHQVICATRTTLMWCNTGHGWALPATCFVLMVLPNTSTTVGHTMLLLQCWACWPSGLGLQSVTRPYMEWVCLWVGLRDLQAVDNACHFAVESIHTHILYRHELLQWGRSKSQTVCMYTE